MLLEYETERLILRVLKPDEADKVLDFYLNDQDLFEEFELDRSPQFYTLEYQKNILTTEYNLTVKGYAVRFYVFLKSNPDQLIGTVCLHNINKSLYKSCEIGYKFSSKYHHMGYATESILMAMEIAFVDLQLHRIIAMVHPRNQASMHLLERLSFQKEGLCKEFIKMRGEWCDHYQYAAISPI